MVTTDASSRAIESSVVSIRVPSDLTFCDFDQALLQAFEWNSMFGRGGADHQYTFDLYDRWCAPNIWGKENGIRPFSKVLSKTARREAEGLVKRTAATGPARRCNPLRASFRRCYAARAIKNNWLASVGERRGDCPFWCVIDENGRPDEVMGCDECKHVDRAIYHDLHRSPLRAQAPGHHSACFRLGWEKEGEDSEPPLCVTARAKSFREGLGRGDIEDGDEMTLGDVFFTFVIKRAKWTVKFGSGSLTTLTHRVTWMDDIGDVPLENMFLPPGKDPDEQLEE